MWSKNKKLKVAIFHLAFVYSGGGEKLVLKEYDLLKKGGYDVTIFTSALDEKKCFPDIIKKYKIKEFLPHSLFERHESFRVLLSSALFPFLSARFKNYDVIFAANQPSPWMGFCVKKIWGVPYVSYLAQPTRFLHPREVDIKTGLKFVKRADESFSVVLMRVFRGIVSWADNVSIRNSDVVLANGEFVKERLRQVYGIDAVSCPAGAGIKKVSGKKRKGGYVLMTNRHFPQKNFEAGISAFLQAIQKYPKIKLVITGEETEYTKELKFLVEKLGIKNRVVFTGYVDEKKMEKYYKGADVYLYTALEEDFGMGIIEAMFFGIPVIAWKNCGPSKIIKTGINGVLVEPGDVFAFGNALVKILADKNLSSRLSANAQKTASSVYSWKKHLNILESSLLSCAKKRHGLKSLNG